MRLVVRAAALAAVLLVAMPAGVANASPIQLGVEAVTDFPVDVGGSIWVELPYRLRLRTTLGVLPSGYADVINDVLVAANAYDQTTANIINAALKSSLVWRLHAGWRPWKRRGAYFEIGYGLVALGGGLTSAQAIGAASGQTPPADSNAGQKGYQVVSLLHMLDVDLGWQWIVTRGLTFRVGVGCALTLGAQTTVKPNFAPRAPEAQTKFTSAAAAYLDSTYTSYVFSPTITFAVGWRFLPWLGKRWSP